jgi:hypothetical protein
MISLSFISGNKLLVCVLGKIAEESAVVTIKTTSGIYKPKDYLKEIEIQLSPNDTELEISITTPKKQSI